MFLNSFVTYVLDSYIALRRASCVTVAQENTDTANSTSQLSPHRMLLPVTTLFTLLSRILLRGNGGKSKATTKSKSETQGKARCKGPPIILRRHPWNSNQPQPLARRRRKALFAYFLWPPGQKVRRLAGRDPPVLSTNGLALIRQQPLQSSPLPPFAAMMRPLLAITITERDQP